MDRCEIHEGHSCWIWQQGVNSVGHPITRHEGRSQLVRRRAFELFHGRSHDGRKRALVPKCGDPLCVSPHCCEDITRSELVKRHTSNRSSPAYYMAYVRGRVSGQPTKLDFEKAREIRADPRPAHVVAAERNCSRSLIVQVRRGEIWRECANNSSAFNRRA